jgi:hypothetical protein
MQHCSVHFYRIIAGQLGAEGFIMGTLYTTVGLAIAGLIMITPKVIS